MTTHQLEAALRSAVVAVLLALEDEDVEDALPALWAAQREWDRRAAAAGLAPSCVCERCFRGYP